MFNDSVASIDASTASHFVRKSGIIVHHGDQMMVFVSAQSFAFDCNRAVSHELSFRMSHRLEGVGHLDLSRNNSHELMPNAIFRRK
jgi:hypothetical protein